MYIETVPNRNSRPAILLREATREGRKIHKRTLANLTDWPPERIHALRCVLRGDQMAPVKERLQIERSLPHGNVQAVLRMLRRLGLDTLIAPKRRRERDLVLAMIVVRLLHPCSKLASTRHWNDTTLAAELDIGDADVDELYDTLDWLLARQERIEDKLAARHLQEGGMVLYDVSSSSYYGHTCPLARFGHNRDGRRDLPAIVYGLLTDRRGCPVAVQAYPGNTGDPTTVDDQVHKLRTRFGLNQVMMVGDRGMLTQARIEVLREQPGIGWISALRNGSIRQLVATGHLQLSLFDQQDLAEIQSPDYPGERLMACFNPLLAEQRARKREELLAATEKLLTQVQNTAARRTRHPLTPEAIGAKVGRVLNRFKMAKHFEWQVADGRLSWQRRQAAIEQEARLDGIYVVRTSASAADLPAADAVRSYKGLSQVERAFRCMKGLDVRIRPIFHHTEAHVRAHIFLCMLAYYLEWNLRQAWAELLFEDEQLAQSRAVRDPVGPAQPSASVQRKKAKRRTTRGLPVHNWTTLMTHLGSCCRHTCRINGAPPEAVFEQDTELTPLQHRAIELVDLYPVPGSRVQR